MPLPPGVGRPRRWALLLGLAAGTGAAGCVPGPEPPDAARQLVVSVDNDITTLDPIRSQEPYSLRVIGQIFEGLVTLGAENELEAVLAERWSHNETYDTWTFEIRRGVYFHEDDVFGERRTREVTADDVAFSFERLVSPESYPAFVLADTIAGVSEFQSGEAPGVAGIKVLGPHAVEFRLRRPDSTFLHRITSPWFTVFPREAVELGPDLFGRAIAIGTGPFRLARRSDTEVVLERNERYWRTVDGNVERLVFRVIRNEQLRLSELRNGRLGIMALPPALIPGVVSGDVAPGDGDAVTLRPELAETFRARSFPTFSSHFVGFNCDRLDVNLRRAISYGIDRREIVSAITRGGGMLATGTVPHGLLGYRPPFEGDIHDPERARRELEQSAFDPATDRIRLLVHEKDSSELLGQLLQAQLGRLGIEVAIERLDYNTVVERMIRGDTEAFALALEYVFSAPEPILENIFHSSKIPVPNFWHYANPEVDAGLDGLRTLGDREAANQAAREIERQIIEDAPAAFLYLARRIVIFRNDVTDVAYNGHGTPLLWRVRVGGQGGGV